MSKSGSWLEFVKQKSKEMPGKALGEILPIASKEWKLMKSKGMVSTGPSNTMMTKSRRSTSRRSTSRKSKKGSKSRKSRK
jgi:hypothetical protein